MNIIPVDALQSALGGLNVAQQLLNITSQNIANAQTAGYTAKSLPIEDQVANGQVIGALTGNITRNVNAALQQSVWTQNGNAASSATINSALSNLQSLYGTADAGVDFSSNLTSVKNDFTQLSGNPASPALQAQTVNDASKFARTLNATAGAVTTARNNAEAAIASAVGTINIQLKTIASLNTQIAQTVGSGNSAANLEDQRDLAINTLSSQLNVKTYSQANGVLVVQTTSGQVLADTSAHSLVFTSQSIGAGIAYPTTLSGVYIDNAATGIDLAADPTRTGGALGGQLLLRDQILPGQQAQLDEVAEQTANRFNAQGLKLFSDATGVIPAATPISSYVGFATAIKVNPAVITNPALVQQGTTGGPLTSGDNAVIDKVLNYTFGLYSDAANTPNTAFNVSGLGINGTIALTGLPPKATLEGFSQSVLSAQATQASLYASQSSYNASYATSLQTTFANSSSVNLDTEVANLTVYQNAYSCAAQVVSTEKKLMSDLLSVVQ